MTLLQKLYRFGKDVYQIGIERRKRFEKINQPANTDMRFRQVIEHNSRGKENYTK